MTTKNTLNASEHFEQIKPGIEALAQKYHVSRQVDAATR